jgi:ribosomal protein S27AE
VRIDLHREEGMALDPADLQKVQGWLEAKFKNKFCPWCGTNAWIVGDVCTMLPLKGMAVQLAGSTIPTVPIACTNCGYVMLLSAVIMGLVMPVGQADGTPTPPSEELGRNP